MVKGRDLAAGQALGPVLARAAAMLRDPASGLAEPAVEAAAGRLLRDLGYDARSTVMAGPDPTTHAAQVAPVAASIVPKVDRPEGRRRVGARIKSAPDEFGGKSRDPDTGAHRAALLLAAARFRRLFQLVSEHAPGLVFVGAEVGGGVSASGVGVTLQAAFEGCVGEAAEYLSQVEVEGDVGLRAPLRAQGATFAALLDPRQAEALDWVRAHRLSDGSAAWVPADLCLRRPSADARRDGYGPLSVGCAASASLPAATLHGLLEVAERDAVRRWRGGRRGRPLALPHPAAIAAARLLAEFRQGAAGQATWLLDITTDLDVPCIAAVSCDLDGRAVAVGSACRPTMAAAARSALLEMCQMELATALAPAKPNETPLDRLRPQGPPATTKDLPEAGPAAALRHVADRLARRRADAFVVDLTRGELAIPVAHVLCPALRRAPG